MKLRECDVVAAVRRLHMRDLRAWVRNGWVRPVPSNRGPLFDDIDVARLRLICDLKKEMALPNNAVPVILSLLDQVHGLRQEMRSLVKAIDQQSAETREAVLKVYANNKESGSSTL